MISKSFKCWSKPFLGSESGSESYSPHTCFRRHPGKALSSVERLEDDAIFDLRPEGPSRRAISVVAWREFQSLWYADHKVTWSLPVHIWPWVLAQTSIFSKNNIEIKNKRNYSKTMKVYFLFSMHKSSDYASSAKLKQKLKIMFVLLNYA